jgi:molybdenum cofactor cytidylyltransferase
MNSPIIAAVLLAAGRGTRFGGNKLEAEFRGAMLGLHAARTLTALNLEHLFAVHDPAHTKLGQALSETGFTLVANDNPAAGQGHSLALAAQAALETDATHMLVCLADMPFVTQHHLQQIIAAGGDDVVASAIDDIRMPPALFPRRLFSALACLSGDMGARALLKNATLIPGDAAMLADIDTRIEMSELDFRG